MKIKTMGIDLAKSVFQVCAMDKRGRVLFNKKIQRNKLLGFVEKQEWEENALVAMESCGGAHHIGRQLGQKGYRVKLISAKFVKPFVKSNKNDAKDAEAISEAASRPNMRFVGLKTVEQQDIQSVHRVREGYIKRRTVVANEIRGLLLEYGVTIPKGITKIKSMIHGILEDPDNGLTIDMRDLIGLLYEELDNCFKKVEELEKKLKVFLGKNEDCKRLEKIDGVGLILATAIVAGVGDPKAFTNGRQFAAWLGLTPRQFSTGGKTKLGKISKRGDRYVRKNLIHGSRAVVNHAGTKEDRMSRWVTGKLPEKGFNKTAVAVANKTARIIWNVLAKKEEYDRDYKRAA